jgi:hypothetical protein
MFEKIASDALQSVLKDNTLYNDFSDHEASILAEWAENRIRQCLSQPLNNDDNARQVVWLEIGRLKKAFKAIARQATNFHVGDRDVVIMASAAVISELWDGDG